MMRIKNRGTKRLLTAAVTLLTLIALVFSLSACASTTTKYGIEGDEEVYTFVARVVAQNETYKTRFVAAYRGYDISEEGFTEPETNIDLGCDVNIGKTVLALALENEKFESDEDKAAFAAFMENLTVEDMTKIVKTMAIKYDLEPSTGFFDFLLVWIGKALGALTTLVGNYYVLAIMIFAVIVEILMLPMAIKQQKNSIGMAKLRPKIAKIEKKYAGRTDQATLRKKQEEIMELQQKEGYSPFSGCLPLIIQLVIVGFILYPIIQNPLRYMLDTSEGFSQALVAYATAPTSQGGLGITLSSPSNIIELLTVFNSTNIQGIASFPLIANGAECLSILESLTIPNFTMFTLNLGKVPQVAIDWLILIPALNVIGQVVSMKLTRKWMGNQQLAAAGADAQTNASMKMMDLVGPLMTLIIMFQVPALIGVYWFFRSMISLLKQFIMQIVLPITKYTEEELREMEKAEKERKKAQKEALKQKPKYRSLHYIDEEDYDELPEIKSTDGNKKKPSGSGFSDIPEIKD